MGGETANRMELMEPPLGPRERLHVLKHDDLFAVFDARGDFYGSLHQVGPSIGADGLFQDDTRILSRLTLRISGVVPELLSGTIGRDNVVFSAHLTNPTFRDRSGRLVPPSQMAIHRRRLLWNRTLYEVCTSETIPQSRFSRILRSRWMRISATSSRSGAWPDFVAARFCHPITQAIR